MAHRHMMHPGDTLAFATKGGTIVVSWRDLDAIFNEQGMAPSGRIANRNQEQRAKAAAEAAAAEAEEEKLAPPTKRVPKIVKRDKSKK